MKKKWIYAALLGAALTFGTSSCDKFLDINTDPNAATTVDPSFLITPIQVRMSSNRTIETGPVFQFYAQQWASGGSAGVFFDPERYNIGVFGPRNTWNTYYNSCLNNVALMELQAREAGNPNVEAQAKIMKAILFYDITCIFGEAPYSEALNVEIQGPKFDSQEEVLRGVVTLCEEAVALADPSNPIPGAFSGDLFYGPSGWSPSSAPAQQMERWIKAANSLKFKALMLLHNGGANVSAEIAAVFNQPMIETLGEDLAVPYAEEVNNANPVWKLLNLYSGGENVWFEACDPLMDLMKESNDPRLATYFDQDGNGAFTSRQSGTNTGSVSPLSLNILRRAFPDRIITASEIALLRAEAMVLGLAPGGQAGAQEEMRRGISLSLDFFDGKPGQIGAAAKQTYINQFNIANQSQAGALRTLHVQQYIDLASLRGLEAWTQWRRTKVPDLTVPAGALLGDIIRRFPYADEEISSNPNNIGQPALDLPMWFEGN
ncbi:SusD/RagB family nutrient-binding outer membrane lipoprotein [Hugenholtzia roseola]|uniref:SusD/RagB family nutrient-binding outer membrane lipoprotein n=1 Tax=Hugenholtzia roseola TaxID=1002 RepID=UPI00040EC035|nr:SusD/RagB family nutrient-binding outer membrane lipoprotein [Hugenholtzia roseola]